MGSQPFLHLGQGWQETTGGSPPLLQPMSRAPAPAPEAQLRRKSLCIYTTKVCKNVPCALLQTDLLFQAEEGRGQIISWQFGALEQKPQKYHILLSPSPSQIFSPNSREWMGRKLGAIVRWPAPILPFRKQALCLCVRSNCATGRRPAGVAFCQHQLLLSQCSGYGSQL